MPGIQACFNIRKSNYTVGVRRKIMFISRDTRKPLAKFNNSFLIKTLNKTGGLVAYFVKMIKHISLILKPESYFMWKHQTFC